jgi:hypothetical protein
MKFYFSALIVFISVCLLGQPEEYAVINEYLSLQNELTIYFKTNNLWLLDKDDSIKINASNFFNNYRLDNSEIESAFLRIDTSYFNAQVKTTDNIKWKSEYLSNKIKLSKKKPKNSNSQSFHYLSYPIFLNKSKDYAIIYDSVVNIGWIFLLKYKEDRWEVIAQDILWQI